MPLGLHHSATGRRYARHAEHEFLADHRQRDGGFKVGEVLADAVPVAGKEGDVR